MPISSIFAAVAAPIVGNIVGQAIGGGTAAQGQQQGAQQQVGGLQQGAQALTNSFNAAGPYLTNAYNTASGLYTPYTTTGTSATTALNNLIGSGYATNQFNNQDLTSQLAPNYNFMLGQGQQATNAATNAAGGMVSGNALQGLDTFTQNYAQNAYQNAFNNYQAQRNNILGNLGTASGQGLTATNQLSNLTTGYGGSMANLNTSYGSALAGNYGQQGAAQGAGTVGAANTMGNMYANTGTMLGALAGNYFGQPNSSQTSDGSLYSSGAGGYTPQQISQGAMNPVSAADQASYMALMS